MRKIYACVLDQNDIGSRYSMQILLSGGGVLFVLEVVLRLHFSRCLSRNTHL